MTIEYLLEILSGAWSILLLCFMVFLIVYLIGQWRENKLTWKDLWALPLGMAVAFAMLVQSAGSFSSRATVWFWRHFQGGQPLSDLNIQALAISAFVAAIGILMMIRVFSRPRYGELPWIVSAAITAIYVLMAVMVRI